MYVFRKVSSDKLLHQYNSLNSVASYPSTTTNDTCSRQLVRSSFLATGPTQGMFYIYRILSEGLKGTSALNCLRTPESKGLAFTLGGNRGIPFCCLGDLHHGFFSTVASPSEATTCNFASDFAPVEGSTAIVTPTGGSLYFCTGSIGISSLSPSLQERRHPFRLFPRLLMAWRDRRQWDWNEKNEKKNRNQRRASESKDSNSNKNAFPSYDRSSGGGSSSSAPSAVGGPSQEQLYQALLACAAKDQSMASLVENLVPQAVSEDQEIRSQQQSLNRIRKCRQKIVKKEALVKTKKEQWTQFVEDMRRHISSEKSRHTTEVQTLEEEITELKEELAQLRSGQDKTEPDEKMDASLDELLDIDSDDKTKQLQEQLRWRFKRHRTLPMQCRPRCKLSSTIKSLQQEQQ